MNYALHNEPSLFAPYQGKIDAFDPDEQADNLKDWQQRYDQISHGQFYGRIDEIQLDQIHVFKEFTNQSVHQECNVWPNGVWLGFSANQKSFRFNGEVIDPTSAVIQPGNRQFELLTPENFFIHGIVLKHSALDKIAQIQGIDLSGVLNTPILKLKESRLKGLSYVLGEFINTDNQVMPGALQQELLIMNLLDSLELSQPIDLESKRPSFSRRQAVVQSIKNHIEMNPYKTITITDLCEVAHVSRRTLQYSFETVMGMSPLKYLKTTRLNDVRRDFQHSINSDRSIAEIAANRGFWHAGQFTRDYTALFGENPSVTLKRNRTQ